MKLQGGAASEAGPGLREGARPGARLGRPFLFCLTMEVAVLLVAPCVPGTELRPSGAFSPWPSDAGTLVPILWRSLETLSSLLELRSSSVAALGFEPTSA